MAKNFTMEDLGLFWSFYRFQSIFVILEALVYLFSHSRGFEGIFVIFSDFGSILIILEVFGHLSGFRGIFAHSICILVILKV